VSKLHAHAKQQVKLVSSILYFNTFEAFEGMINYSELNGSKYSKCNLNSADPSGHLVVGIMSLNPAWGMDDCLLCLYVVLSCVGRGLCDRLITHTEESYRVSLYV
jgi:hypothetical protein